MAVMNMVEAINNALLIAMEKDPDVVLLGEDIGKDGGVFRVTDGLWKKFGDRRVIDTPLSESGIVGTAIGMAVYGLKPVAEIQFEGFTLPALDQLISHAARIRNRSRGRYHVPLVVRSPFGGGIHALEHHSDSPEVYFAHTPGLKVVIPSRPSDAKGLLLSAIRDPDPVIFFEPKKLYRSIKEDVPEKDYTIPLGKARILQQGTDVTLITWAGSVKTAQKVAEEFKEDVSIEVIDVRTISPLDTETILASVRKTGRAVIVHEAPRTAGFGAEIAALLSEKAIDSLQAPIKRVTGYDVIVPLPQLEDYYIPSDKKILQAIDEVMHF